MELRGIDVSKWNGNIDWAKVRASGIDFAMIKAANGSNKGTYSMDPKFEFNIREAYDAGLHCGVYLYSYAKTPSGAADEAKFLLSKLEPYKKLITFPVAYDLEDISQQSLPKSVLTSMCRSFCDAVRAAGYKPMLYSNTSWLTTKIDSTQVNADIWLAHWATKPTWNGKYTMWQYSSKGAVAGISGSVDMDIGYVNYTEEDNMSASHNGTSSDKNIGTPSSWAASSWAKAVSLGVVDGTSPQGNVTREQLAVILDRLGLLK